MEVERIVKLKLFISTLILLVVVLLVTGINHTLRADTASYAYAQDNLIRLHVVAESNEPIDQSIKLEVRDEILSVTSEMFRTIPSKEDAEEIIEKNILLMQNIAEDVISSHDKNYTVKIEMGNYYFPKTQYGDYTYPAGNYDALRIVLGQGMGKNWWCVLFPPLCFADITSGDDEIIAEYPYLTETVVIGGTVDGIMVDDNSQDTSGWKLKTRSSISFIQLIATPFSYLSGIFRGSNY